MQIAITTPQRVFIVVIRRAAADEDVLTVVTHQLVGAEAANEEIVPRGGVDPHAGLGPVPVFVLLGCFDTQASEDSGQQITEDGAKRVSLQTLAIHRSPGAAE